MSANETSMTKHQWRRWLGWVALSASPAISVRVLQHLNEFLDARSGAVLTYRPMVSELDLDPLLDRPDSERFHVTRSNPNGVLSVHKASSPTELHPYGFAQPIDGTEQVDPATIAIVLVPAVAFGRDGSRLGHGAGYYDRLLPKVGTDAALVGVAHEAMIVPAVPVDLHDVSMTHLVSESGLVMFGTT